MSSTTGSNDGVPAITADTPMTDAERAIWNAAFEAGKKVGFKSGRNRGYRQAIGVCKALITQMPDQPAPLPEEQEPEADVPLSSPIDVLGLGDRTRNILQREGIHTISDIFRYDEEDLMDIRLLGTAGVNEIIAKLMLVGYTYRTS